MALDGRIEPGDMILQVNEVGEDIFLGNLGSESCYFQHLHLLIYRWPSKTSPTTKRWMF